MTPVSDTLEFQKWVADTVIGLLVFEKRMDKGFAGKEALTFMGSRMQCMSMAVAFQPMQALTLDEQEVPTNLWDMAGEVTLH